MLLQGTVECWSVLFNSRIILMYRIVLLQGTVPIIIMHLAPTGHGGGAFVTFNRR